MITILDKCIESSEAELVENRLLDANFPWFFHPKTVKNIKKTEHIFDTIQYTHTFYQFQNNIGVPNSSFTNIVEDLLRYFLIDQKISQCEILRCRVNMQLQNSQKTDHSYNAPHVDIDIPHFVLLYYVNDSDGDTFIFNKKTEIIKQVSPRRGRFVLFDGSNLHAGSHPKYNTHRCVINYNLRFMQ